MAPRPLRWARVEGTIQSNGLVTREPIPGPEAERIAADQLRQSIEVSELEKVLS